MHTEDPPVEMWQSRGTVAHASMDRYWFSYLRAGYAETDMAPAGSRKFGQRGLDVNVGPG